MLTILMSMTDLRRCADHMLIMAEIDDLHTKANNAGKVRTDTDRLPTDEEEAKETLPDLRKDTEG